MPRTPHSSRASLPPFARATLVVLAAGLPWLFAGSAGAAAPARPVMMDGVRHSAADVERLRDRPLYVVSTKAGSPLVGFTRKAEFSAYVRDRLGVDLSRTKRARAASASGYGLFYDNWSPVVLWGRMIHTDANWGERDLRYVSCFLWICSNENDMISAVVTRDATAVMWSDIQYKGSAYVVGPGQYHQVASWFDNRASSLWVYP